MASIVKKRKLFYVVYYYTDNNGDKKQKWEPYTNITDAKRRKTEVEYVQNEGVFIAPSATTVQELLEEFTHSYGQEEWSLSTYAAKKAMMNHYIIPYIGTLKLKDITPKTMDNYYGMLKTVKQVSRNGKTSETVYITPRMIREIHKILNCAFKRAVSWEYMVRNPVENAILPKVVKGKRDVWAAETVFKALSLCEDDLLTICIHLAFACSMRLGEILGLTWDTVDISEESIAENNASVYIDKELKRVSIEAMQFLSNKDIVKVFPSVLAAKKTMLVLKKPKTESSERRVWLPNTVALYLQKLKREQAELKEFFGAEYVDYHLVIAQENGRPVEQKIIEKRFQALIEANGLPRVVFHSLRHTSTTYKLKMTQGNMKAVQGDTGHAQASMVLDVYSHIMDEERRQNAWQFENEFYQKYAPNEQNKNEANDKKDELYQMLEQSPEMRERVLEFLKITQNGT